MDVEPGQFFLIPGNSPIGLRLPLDSLPAVAKENEPQKVERSFLKNCLTGKFS